MEQKLELHSGQKTPNIFFKKHYIWAMLKQESISIPEWYIFYRKFMTFVRTGRTLHFFFILSLISFFFSVKMLLNDQNGIVSFYILPVMFFFSLCITTVLDAYNRYQNYKMVKDLLHQYGFRELIVKPFSKSSCQRDAASEAARQLELSEMTDKYFYRLGYRWYHIIPSILVENPTTFFTKMYWVSTFFVPRYKSKYFLW